MLVDMRKICADVGAHYANLMNISELEPQDFTRELEEASELLLQALILLQRAEKLMKS